MGSGYYPQSGTEESKELLETLKKIKQVNEQIASSACCGDTGQFDNSYADGQSVALVRLAIGLLAKEFGIKKEIEEFEPKIDY